ncbi:hypothetical protein cypCar_00044562 [Cyprinus carpio]|nr:hypothetical protein cypCar_00044562 [Cyprinus carpio]
MQAPMTPLTWHFPIIPEEPQQPDVPFELCVPIALQSVAAQCGDNFVHVEVKKDFFGTDDWMFERPSNQYFLGQFLKLEASVKQYNHVPLRIFVDGCVATAAPDVNTTTTSPRYSFIENHGCLVDAKLTGSTSNFMRRVQSDKLQFQLEAFRFLQDDRGLVYVTCDLKAVMASTPTSPENKACSFSDGWTSVDDNDQVCMCCDSTCGLGRKGPVPSDSGMVSEGKATIGPIVITH